MALNPDRVWSPVQFASVVYILFLALSVAIYFALPGQRSRTAWLLLASYAFYLTLSAGWTVVLAVVTLIGYTAGRAIERAGTAGGAASGAAGSRPGTARGVLVSAIVAVGLVLAAFKYAPITQKALDGILSLAGIADGGPTLALVLPVGISFWTFQTISYLVDVYRGTLVAERDPIRYATFIAFFPHVTAGPIARGGQLLPQLAEKRSFSYEGMRSGLLLLLWGFFKKTLVADRMGIFVASVYGDPHKYSGSGLVLAAASIGFAIQIYCDFSGYTDIVRGSARLFGIDLLRNFDRPYAARSVKEFWRRWHMSLMGWLKDYIYIPLGGSRVPQWRRYLNILAVFAFSGIWHGAGLTFLVWGLLNGAYQVLGELLAPLRKRLLALSRLRRDGLVHRVLSTATTFVLITIAWVFFRADTLADALYIVPRMFVPTAAFLGDLKSFDIGLTLPEVALTAVCVVVVFAVDHLSTRVDLPALIYRQPLVVRSLAYQAATMFIVIFGSYGPTVRAADFVYFKF